MQIGTVIRKYRKEKNMTQEEMASYLGVTAPAVNKWENGNACPDIMLLAPIARLLGISTDTLLSYREELTKQEIANISNEIGKRLMKEPYEDVFRSAMQKIQEYPNCGKLAFVLAQILDSYFGIEDVRGKEQYKKEILAIYDRALESEEEEIRQGAIIALYNECLRTEQYELAQSYLDRIPKKWINLDRLQAMLYRKAGKRQEAYELLERILFQSCSEINVCFQGLYLLEMEKNDVARAEKLMEKAEEISRILEMSDYMILSPRFNMALDRKDKEECLILLEQQIASIETIDSFKKADLYRHMQFAETSDRSMVKAMLRKALENDEEIGLLRGDERFQKLIKRLS